MLQCEGHPDSIPLPRYVPPDTCSLPIISLLVPASSWRDPGRGHAHIPFKRCPLPTLHRQRLCRRRHMFCHRLSYMRGKGELYPAVFSGCWQRAVTHFLLLPFILTVKVFNPESVLTFHPFHAPTFFLGTDYFLKPAFSCRSS